jgi:hypothetical protein
MAAVVSLVASMMITILANAASLSAPLVLVILIVALTLLLLRASCGALEIALKKKVSRRLDVVTALVLLLLAVSVVWRFKVIG